jgi:hypothetical protein
LLAFFLLGLGTAQAQTAASDQKVVTLVSPSEGSETIGKKPLIECRLNQAYDKDQILVLLDGVDITPVIDFTSQGFSYRPIEVLLSGPHTLTVAGATESGEPFEEMFDFDSRHTGPFEEAYVTSELTAFYENSLDRSDAYSEQNRWKFEGNLGAEAIVREKGWNVSVKTNIRSLQQNKPVEPPEDEDLQLIDLLLSAGYTKGQFSALTEIGDTQVDESPNTVSNLARRGGRLAFQYSDFILSGFIMEGREVYAWGEGTTIDTNTDDNIAGLSAQAGFFDNQVTFKTIFASGGDKGNYFGTWSEEGPRQGDVLGFVLTTDFIDQKFITDFELDYSDFDTNAEDEESSLSDRAFRIGVGGTIDRYTYAATYRYFGPDYEVVSNPNLERDYAGIELIGGGNFETQSVELSYSQFHDNVDHSDLYQRSCTYRGGITYSYFGLEYLPFSILFEKAYLDAEDVPEGQEAVSSDTNTVSGQINFIKRFLDIGLEVSYSSQDDKSSANEDNDIASVTLTPSFTTDHFYASSNIGYQQTWDKLTDVDTDYYLVTLDVRGDIFAENLIYALAGSWDRTRTSDRLIDIDTLKGDIHIAYLLGRNILGFLNPSVGLKALYERTDDKVTNTTENEYAIMLTIDLSMPYSF